MDSDLGSDAIPVGHKSKLNSKLNLTSYQWGTDRSQVWDHISGAEMEIGFGTISVYQLDTYGNRVWDHISWGFGRNCG